jgi:hypothetical protein
MQSDEQGEPETEDSQWNEEMAIRQDGSDFVAVRHRFLSVLASVELAGYFSELMSITKRYFTSCFNIRSKASLIFWIGMTSTSAVMLFLPQ